MDAILLGITGISLTAAAVMGVLFARLLRDERRRSDARVALLTDLASRHGRIEPTIDELLVPAVPVAPVARAVVADSPVRRVVRERPAQPVRPAAPPIRLEPEEAAAPVTVRRSRTLDFDEIDIRPAAEEVPTVHGLFNEREERSAWPRRIAVVGGIAAMIVVGVFAWSNLAGSRSPEAAPAGQVSEVAVDTPLELLSLKHTLQDGVFTITGLVQNPRAARQLANVKVTLLVFGPNGTFLTSGRSPLDFTSLGPGDESSFVVSVKVKGDVARYRIGFRGDDDRVLAHVDRRPADAVAAK